MSYEHSNHSFNDSSFDVPLEQYVDPGDIIEDDISWSDISASDIPRGISRRRDVIVVDDSSSDIPVRQRRTGDSLDDLPGSDDISDSEISLRQQRTTHKPTSKKTRHSSKSQRGRVEPVRGRDRSPARPLPQLRSVVVGTTRDATPPRNPAGQPAKTPKSMAQQWCYTLNHPTRADVERLRGVHRSNTPKVVYHVFQLETGRSGTLHVQGFICLASRAQLSTVKTFLGGNPHLEVTRGTPEQAAAYCKDPAKRDPRHRGFLHEYGELPVAQNQGQGKRNDITAVQSLLDSSTPMVDVAKQHFGTWVKYHKAFDKYATEFVAPPRTTKTLVFVFWGESGTGKSQAAYQFRAAFTVPPGSSGVTWFDGYDPTKHKVVLFDEFYGSRCPHNELLRLTDKYAATVNTKGSQTQFNPAAMVFTSNSNPRDWYPNIQEKRPLDRRIDAEWEYFRRDTKALVPNYEQAIAAHEEATGNKYHAIVQCKRGLEYGHPKLTELVPIHLREGEHWYGILPEDETHPEPVEGLW